MRVANVIVLTQTCDLLNAKARSVALCPVHTVEDYLQHDSGFAQNARSIIQAMRKGRIEGRHLLGGQEDPADGRQLLIVDFGEIHSLPLQYLREYAAGLGDRWRLRSPFLEHFSQAFARYYMRVGLPTQVPEYPLPAVQ